MGTDARVRPSYRALARYEVIETTYGEFVLIYASPHEEENQGRLKRRGRDLRLVRHTGSTIDFMNAPRRILRAPTLAVSTIALAFDGTYSHSLIDGNSPICTEPLPEFLEQKFTWLRQPPDPSGGSPTQGLFPALVERSFSFGVWISETGSEDGWLAADCYAPESVCSVPRDRQFLQPSSGLLISH